MPFLFVDYDQGAGGEFFCTQLSQTPQCNSLCSSSDDKNRFKVKDVFNQAWLDSSIGIVPCDSDAVKFDVVPCHRRTAEAKKILKNVKCIRIANPLDDHLWSFLKHNQKNKVLLSTQKQSGLYFIGDLKLAVKKSQSKDWVRKVNINTTNLDVRLLSTGVEPSESAKVDYIRKLYNLRVKEPDLDWDLVIPYEKLFFDVDWVIDQLHKVFGIELQAHALEKFYKNYVEFTLNSST